MKSNEWILVTAAAAAFLVWKSPDSGQSTLQKMQAAAAEKAANEKNPAFIYFPRDTLTGDQEMHLIRGLFGQAGLTGSGTKDGSPVTPEQHAQVITLLEEAIAYYRHRPEKRLEQTRDMLIEKKNEILAPYNKAQGVGMGPISGFSGVY